MNLLVSKTLLVCLLVLVLRTVIVTGAAHDHGQCVRDARLEYNERMKKNLENIFDIDISTEARLVKDSHGHISVDHGETSYILKENSSVISDQHHTGRSQVRLESGDNVVILDTDHTGATSLTLMIRNSTHNCSVNLGEQTSDLHADLILHPVFFTLSFSPDGEYLIYLASSVVKTGEVEWSQYSPNMGGLHSWKEKVFRPTLYLVSVRTQEVTPLELDQGKVSGQSVWTQDSRHVITVARDHQWTPCPECTDQSTQLIMINIDTRQTRVLTSETTHVSPPRVVPGQDKIVFFSNSLTVDYTPPDSDETVSVPNLITAPQSLITMTLDTLETSMIIDENTKLDTNLGHIYSNRVHPWPHRMFLKVLINLIN